MGKIMILEGLGNDTGCAPCQALGNVKVTKTGLFVIAAALIGLYIAGR